MSSHQIPLWRTFESGSSPLVLGGGGGGEEVVKTLVSFPDPTFLFPRVEVGVVWERD